MSASSQQRRNLLLAVLLSPLSMIPAMLLLQSLAFLFSTEPQTDLLQQYSGGLIIATIGLVYGYGAVLTYGLPLYLLLRKIGRNSLLNTLLASLLPALIVRLAAADSWSSSLVTAYFSLLIGLCFWLLAERKGRSINTERPLHEHLKFRVRC